MKTIGIINVDGTTELREVPKDPEGGGHLNHLQAAVGGYIEALNVPHSRAQVYVNEEGLLVGLPVNRPMYAAYALQFAGPVVVYFKGRNTTQADLDAIVKPTQAQAMKMYKLYNWTPY